MARPARRPRALLVATLTALASALVAGLALVGPTPVPTPSTTVTTTVTTTTIARERPQPGWAVVEASGRGVMVDVRTVTVGVARFRVVRLRARTTLLRWHVGLGDPSAWMKVPADAGPSIDWPVEGRAGVVAVFNGGFKQSGRAGGVMADGLVLEPPLPGRETIALDAAGRWAMGVWGAPGFPPRGFAPVSYRQNLVALVAGAAPTPAASGPVLAWGSPLGNVAAEPRTALGVDEHGNLLYVATMDDVLPADLARALVRAGAVEAMELDINPFWPIAGVPRRPLRGVHGSYVVDVPGQQHNANVYNTGWIRDFFVALAEPSSWSCHWAGPGLRPGAVPQAQDLRLVGRCGAARTTTTLAGG